MSARLRRIRDHRILCLGVRGRALGVVGMTSVAVMTLLVEGRGAWMLVGVLGESVCVARVDFFGEAVEGRVAWVLVGVHGESVCVARLNFFGETLRGSGLDGESSIVTSFHAGGCVPVVDGPG